MTRRVRVGLMTLLLAGIGAALAAGQRPSAEGVAWETLARLPLPEDSDPVIAVSHFRLNAAPANPAPIGAGHKHQGPVIGYIIQGEIETEIEPTPPAFYKPGEFFSEPAGHLHRFMRNARTTEPAALITFSAGARGQPVPFIKLLLEERLASTKSQEVSLSRLSLPPGAHSDAHSHSGPGLVYVLEGTVETVGAVGPPSAYSAGATVLDPAVADGLIFKNSSGSDGAKILLYHVSTIGTKPESRR